MKPFTWSYSRLKNFETCPKRHWEIDIAKNIREEESEQLKWGDQIHKSAAKRLSIGTPLPPGMETLGTWCERLLTTPGNILVERKLAITKTFGACDYFGAEVWFRSIADVLKISGPVALAIDWKTGKILEDSVQLALMAVCIFAHYPEVHKIRTEFVWLREGPGVSTREDFERDGMPVLWRNLMPRIDQLELAHTTTTYPAKPGGLCRRYCPVTSCPYHGKGNQ